jgi:molecular chaperone GrpE
MKDNNTKDWKKVREETERLIDEQETAEQNQREAEMQAEEEGGSTGSDGESGLGILDHPSYKELEERLTLAEQKADENKEQMRRALAELENVRSRAAKDVANAHRYGQEKFIVSLLPVIDSLEQAIQLVDKDNHASMLEGLALTLQLFLDVLKKNGVEQIDPIGALFNPHEHEAMSIQDVPDALPNSIVTVFQKGYKLSERIIRPARVIVAKG